MHSFLRCALLAALAVGSAAGQVVLTTISTPFNGPIGIDYHAPTNSLIMSANYPTGLPTNLERVLPNGTRIPFSSLSGLTDELKIATVKVNTQTVPGPGFLVGEVFTGNGRDGEIVRIGANGIPANPIFPYTWVSLPGANNGLMRGSLFHDSTGVFGGDLIVATTRGEVWRINTAGVPTFVANVDTSVPRHLEGLLVVPNNPGRYGPLAGKIIAGNERTGVGADGVLYAIDTFGAVTSYAGLGVAIEDIDLVPAGGTFFGVDFADGRLLAAPAANFSAMVGDILLTQEIGFALDPSGFVASGLFRLTWDGTALVATELTYGTGSFQPVKQWEHVAFARVGVVPFPNGGVTGPSFVRPPYTVVAGGSLNFEVFGEDPVSTDVVTMDATGVPTGMTFSPALPATGNPVFSSCSWSPTAAQVGTYTMQVTLTDQTGLQTVIVIDITVIPCFETSLGTNIGLGNDVVLPAQPIGFPFPFGPNATTYTDIHVCTNGFFYLSNSGVPTPGGALCCVGTTTGFNSGSPKICPLWHDLNLTLANAAAVYVNSSSTRCTITWRNAVENGNGVPFTVQAQLTNTGEIQFFYDGNVQVRTSGDCLVGMSAGSGTGGANGVDLSTSPPSITHNNYELFDNANDPFDLAGASVLYRRTPVGQPDRREVTISRCGAAHSPFGIGCYGPSIAPVLSASPPPVSTLTTGTVVTYTTSNMREFAPGAGIYIGVNFLSLGEASPPIDLGLLGAPGCLLFIASLDLAQSMVGATPVQSVTFTVPAGVPSGTELFSQSTVLITPNSLPSGQNALGALVSNAVRSYIASF